MMITNSDSKWSVGFGEIYTNWTRVEIKYHRSGWLIPTHQNFLLLLLRRYKTVTHNLFLKCTDLSNSVYQPIKQLTPTYKPVFTFGLSFGSFPILYYKHSCGQEESSTNHTHKRGDIQ